MFKVSARILVCAMVASTISMVAPGRALALVPSNTPDVGVQFHAMWSDYTDAERLQVVNKMADAGLKWLRIDFGWSSIQPFNRDSYAQWYFERADRVINAANARGMKVLLTFWRTPNWANGNKGPYAPPTNPADFGRAARYTAAYFKGRVDAYEVWNEPNLKGGGFWSGTIADYTDLLKASYDDFHAGDPNAKVLAGSVVYNDDTWLKAMYDAGAKGYFDVIATHPYQGIANEPPEAPDNGTKWRLSHVEAVHRLMRSYGDGDKPIWFTEFGWSSHPNAGELGNWEQGVTSEQQADFMIRAIKYVAQNHPYVKKMFWYNERNQDSGKIQLDNYGLLNRDLSAKPVYHRVKAYLTDPVPTPEPEPVPDPEPTVDPEPTIDPVPDPEPTTEPSPEPTVEPVPDPEPVTKVKKNLLGNGGFEKGRTGWGTDGASLEVARVAYSGKRGGRVAPQRKLARVGTSTGEIPSTVERVELSGFVKSRKAGRVVQVEVQEVVRGLVLNSRAAWFRIKAGKWRALPTLSVKTSGLPGARLAVKIRSGGPNPGRIFVDGFKLAPVA